ncbi:MAG: cell division protein FtsA [Candidatus Pacebacteria bacterium RIFOXYB1_FULL_39_46]|nr:MAG: cell division protein FtsA [Candidatus Pacebacteria bacterium RIFOXYB1_FULL_39_46]OGJ38819.1 MAG: cell division protein FtsA [Candidatus Pacebacteria bacterium RIFOXYA1_FULL_38_18]OGJ40642.1 MAG: cell division protein FtsA [Candidatus Pacebacteria bacterium RIFOXYD1_FULL_39_27]OGJ40812.1 MAG: cell division protein FtsA [Candidatus Pacebacteria bacterium RIFOXYC1_FULL_39_21]
MPKKQVITAIDLGTEKCVTIIAVVDEETGELKVVGVSVVPAKGMKRSVIVDLDQVLSSISQSLDAAERMAGFDVRSVYVAVSGTHVVSKNSKGVVAVAAPDQEITAHDVERVIEAARAISLPADTKIMHVIPRDFKVDSQEGIKDPVGMTGVRLESEAHIITGMSTTLRNLEKVINDLGLEVDGFVFAGLAASEVVLSETEKELGAVVIDMGAGTTSLSAFVEGALEYSGAVPVGARHITQDIALGCRISLDNAEKIKMLLSSEDQETYKARAGESKEELMRRRKKADKIDLAKQGIHEGVETLSRRTVIEGIMMPRIKEIFELIAKDLEKHNVLDKVPAGVILCGGGAHTIGITEVAKRVLNLPVRIGNPTLPKGLVSDIKGSSFATSIGLLYYGKSHGISLVGQTGIGSLFEGIELKNIGSKLKGVFKSMMP